MVHEFRPQLAAATAASPQPEKYVPAITPEDIEYMAPFAEAGPISINIYADATVTIRQADWYFVPKDAYSMIALRIKEDVQLAHLPALNHRRREIVLRFSQSPLYNKHPLEWFIYRIYWRYAEQRLRPADYTVTVHPFPYPDYAGIK